MNSVIVYIKTFKSKAGIPFSKASCKGKYLPKAAINHQNPIDESAYYVVIPCQFSLPVNKDGKYQIFFDRGWVDTRKGDDSHIVRLQGENRSTPIVEYLGKGEKKQDESFPDEE